MMSSMESRRLPHDVVDYGIVVGLDGDPFEALALHLNRHRKVLRFDLGVPPPTPDCIASRRVSIDILRYQPGYGEGRRSVKGEGIRKKRHSKKRRIERISTRPNPAPPSLDDPDPRGNSDATAWLLLHHVLRRRPETPAAFDVIIKRCR
ncbi:hypothetical protein B296_00005538 [Ensete ventricosum]|uniref:Uncharacterized protein n=1 Tax=Ensete ventricosum TaxID=4639 RepID=A0A427ATG0_ENSVE|nr:hypothetical protein B296_00005538 [Ensete ventricosum]